MIFIYNVRTLYLQENKLALFYDSASHLPEFTVQFHLGSRVSHFGIIQGDKEFFKHILTINEPLNHGISNDCL